MSKCIIHVGTRKTGSSSIQKSLNGFRNDKFYYPNLSQTNHGAIIYSLFSDNPSRIANHINNNRTQADINDFNINAVNNLERCIHESRKKIFILSAEVISARMTKKELSKFKEYLYSQFREIEIVAYVRSPAAYITSNFQQRVKDKAKKIDFFRDYFFYKDTLSKFDEVFGRDNVQLWKFDPDVFPGSCVVKDFCSRLGIAIPEERIVRVNDSISRQAVSLLFTYRKYGKELGSTRMTGEQNRHLIENLSGIGHDKFRFSPDIIRPVLENYKTDIEWAEERLGNSLQEDIGEHRPGDIRNESDLLTPDPDAIEKLLEVLDGRVSEGIKGETPEEVALLVHALHKKDGKNFIKKIKERLNRHYAWNKME